VNDKTITVIILSLFLSSIVVGGILSATFNSPIWILVSMALSTIFGIIINQVDKYFNKGTQPTDNEGEIAKAVIAFSHKWHKSYIKVLRFMLEVSGIFNSAKIVNDVDKNKATELLYYTLIAGMAVYSGIQGIAAFKKALMSKDIAYAASDFSLGTFEAALAQIKAGEVKTFLNKVLK
jgi:hypothetical protein